MKMTGAQILLESLKREGAKHIFGYPGGVVLNIFDLFYDEKTGAMNCYSVINKMFFQWGVILRQSSGAWHLLQLNIYD